MSKKYTGRFVNAKGIQVGRYGPVYGKWTYKKLDLLRMAGLHAGACYCDIFRESGGESVRLFRYDVTKGWTDVPLSMLRGSK